jgi:uncharacterized phage protein (TIGR01671 family)
MKRGIKFRAWESVVEKMTEPFSLTELASEMPRNMENYILMQFTGLLDKNGKEIYEGDVIKHSGYYSGDNKHNEGLFVVEWVLNGFNDDLLAGYADCPEWIEVVGNIYENPELLSKLK